MKLKNPYDFEHIINIAKIMGHDFSPTEIYILMNDKSQLVKNIGLFEEIVLDEKNNYY